LLLAALLAGGITYVMYSRLRKNAARPQLTQIVSAAKDLPAGVALGADDVTMIDWPVSVPLPGSFTKTEQVVGRPLIYTLGAREPVLERDLAIPGSGIGLSVKIPAGMRATSVRSNEVVGVAGFLFPGSHVDVLATFNVPGNPDPITNTLLQNVEVLTAGEKIEPDPQGKPQTVNVVTLLLNPEDSQKLLMASTQSSIQFVLRNGADQSKATVPATRLNQLIGLTAPAPPPVPGRRGGVTKAKPAPPPPPHLYVVEVIQGQTRSTEKFQGETPEGSGAKNQ
jgi:pilus assembly protein CpaB